MSTLEKFWLVKKAPKSGNVSGNFNKVYTTLEEAEEACAKYTSESGGTYVVLEAVSAFEPIPSVQEVRIVCKTLK
jgi:hypothetical protein